MNNVQLGIKIDPDLKRAVESFILQNPRKGRRNVSELTERLWLRHILRHQLILPPQMADALRRYCKEKTCTRSQVIRLALRQFIPQRYFAEARKRSEKRGSR